MIRNVVTAAVLGIAAMVPAEAGEAIPRLEADGFTRERAYLEPGAAPVSQGVHGLIRSLERARGVSNVAGVPAVIPHYSLDAALWERTWRVRVSRELEGLLR